jgi:hypothetical protein
MQQRRRVFMFRPRYRAYLVSLLCGSLAGLTGFAATVGAQTPPAPEQPTQAEPSQANPPPATPPEVAPPPPPSEPAPAEQTPALPSPSSPEVRLPQLTIRAPVRQAKPRPTVAQRAAPLPPPSNAVPVNPVTAKNDRFDEARSNLFTTVGTTADTKNHAAIEALPQGANQPVEKVILQSPGVTQDSAASGSFHIRNEHANTQFRINGIMLPDGVSGFGSILETGLIGNISLVTGALPAEFGLRTSGLIDITTRADAFNNSGSVSLYGGSRGTFTPSFEYGGTFGSTCPASEPAPKPGAASFAANCFPGVQYFFTGRYLQTTEGIENPLPTLNAIHDFSEQQRGFAYLSTFVDPATRISLIAGTAANKFQVPDTPNQPIDSAIAIPTFGMTSFDSSKINENQTEFTQFAVLAAQRSTPGFDGQISYFTRYDALHFTPDWIGDLFLNGISSEITRKSYTNGIQGDGAFTLGPANTLRAGFTVSAEHAFVANSSLTEPCILCDGTDSGPPTGIYDFNSKLGWLAGVYLQDEWKITDQLTMNAGLRFDQMMQYVDANQLSPRLSFTYKPFELTTFHAGYAHYFTPPILVEAAPTNVAEFANTTGAPPGSGNSPVLPERSHYFDAGVDQKIPLGCATDLARECTTLDLGVDAYYKIAKDLLDDGNFGNALVLDGFNYAKGINKGVEFSAKFHSGNFDAYFNYAYARQKATQVVSNQYLFDNVNPDPALGGQTEFAYIASHWIDTDHSQIQTASTGAAYKFCGRPSDPGEMWWDSWCGTRISADMIYGSGLRQGSANIDHLPAYAQFNAGISHEFAMPDGKPITLRFDVVNLLDTIYQIRSGTGIGVFAPQWGPRRGYYFGISKKI